MQGRGLDHGTVASTDTRTGVTAHPGLLLVHPCARVRMPPDAVQETLNEQQQARTTAQ